MRCPVCQTKQKRKAQSCSHCGSTIQPSQRWEKLKQILPGFRTGKRYKKILACFIYALMGLIILTTYLGRPTGADASTKTVFLFYLSAFVDFFFLFLLPFLLCSNFMGIRNRLPLFKEKKRSKTILATVLLCVICLLAYVGLSSQIFNAALSPEKRAALSLANEERQQKEALIVAANAEEEEQEKASQKQEEEEATQEKTRVKEEAKKQKEQEEASQKQEKEEAAQEKTRAKEEAKKQKAFEKECRNIDKAYQDRDTTELKSLAQTVSSEAYLYLIQKCEKDYLRLLNNYRSDLNNMNYSRLGGFKNSIEYLRLGFPELQHIDLVSQKASEILERKEASEQLYTGSIKNEESLTYLDVYVDYRIQNGTFDQYLDEYKICSYEYEYWGEKPTSDWEGVLASSDNIQEGILQSYAISTTTQSYVTGDGFKKSYMVYRLVSDQEVDAFYAAMEQQETAQYQLQTLWESFQKMLA